MSLGEKIIELRKKNNLTQEELADKLGVSNKTISKWEHDNSKPDIGMLKEISKIFNVPVESLVDVATSKDNAKKFKFSFNNIISFIIKNWIRIVFGFLFIFLLMYFVSNYNSIRVYEIVNSDNNLSIENGCLIESKSKNTLIISHINTSELDNNSSVRVILYTLINSDKYIIYESDDLETIYIENIDSANLALNDLLKAIEKELYLKIELTDKSNEVKTFETKLDVIKSFANDGFIYFNEGKYENIAMLNDNDVITEEKLLSKGFKKDNETGLYIKDGNERIKIDLDHIIIYVDIINKTNSESYKLYNEDKFIKIEKYKSNKIYLNYKYYYDEEIVDCFEGDCSSYLDDYEYVMSIYNSLKE